MEYLRLHPSNHTVSQAMQGLSNLGQGSLGGGRIPSEAAAPEDDGLGERSVYKDLDLAPHIDAIMHQHCKFLVQHGEGHVSHT